MISLQSRIRRARAIIDARVSGGGTESGVALLTAILFMILMASVSVVLVSSVLSQTVPSYIAQKGTKTIYAAQAGMQTALGIIRSVALAPDYTGAVYGDRTKLPCTLTGRVNAQSDGITYSVTISYFTLDPTGMSSSWLASNKMACSATTGVSTQPKYATVVSQGLAPAVPGIANASIANRSISAIYKFKVSNVNVVGGRFYDSSNGYCLDAVTATAGSLIRFLPLAQCTNDPNELWIYDTDYKIKLASTTVGGAAGLCITGPVAWGGATQSAVLQPCLSTTDPLRWNQLWSWTNWFQGQNITIASGLSSYCLITGYSGGTVLTGKNLLVGNGCSGGGLSPSNQMGAGAASYATKQIVNFKEFGRCADVTNESITYSFMISYPCKQDATGTGAALNWNHKWYYTEPAPPATSLGNQQIYVYYLDNIASKYCLTTPTTGNGSYPTFATCNGSASQNWTRVYNTGSYVASYIFTDRYGRCLTADVTDKYNGSWSKLTAATCNGSDYQKWNAPPTYTDSTIASYKEVAP
jgi:hypothetical protein